MSSVASSASPLPISELAESTPCALVVRESRGEVRLSPLEGAERRSRVGPMARAQNYAALVRPRIAALVLVTVTIGMFLGGWGPPSLILLGQTLLATALVAASAGTFNQWLERDADRMMPRTADRPLPAGRLAPREAIVFGLLTLIPGVAWLVFAAGWMTGLLGFATWALYVVAYTPLKRRTSANTAVGAIAGALPVMMGWAAAGAEWNVGAASLFLIVYLWQFPHFMAIAWIYRREYARAGMQMLTVIDPTGRRAGRMALVGSAALWGVSLVPAMVWLTPERASLYLLGASLLGLWLLWGTVAFNRSLDEVSARRLLRLTLVYLPLLLVWIVVAALW